MPCALHRDAQVFCCCTRCPPTHELFQELRSMPASQEAATPAVIVWDVPVRLFHWLIVAAIAVSWWSAENRLMNVHRYSGYTLLGLLVFRIYWGIVGSPT